MKLKGRILYLGIAILTALIIYRTGLSITEFIILLIGIICIGFGTTWED